jgi:hypothetical protein
VKPQALADLAHYAAMGGSRLTYYVVAEADPDASLNNTLLGAQPYPPTADELTRYAAEYGGPVYVVPVPEPEALFQDTINLWCDGDLFARDRLLVDFPRPIWEPTVQDLADLAGIVSSRQPVTRWTTHADGTRWGWTCAVPLN